MRSFKRISLIFLCLGFFLYLMISYSSNKKHSALSRAYLDKSLSTHDLGESFIFELPCDKALHRTARNLIKIRQKTYFNEKDSKIPHIIHQIWPFESPLTDNLAHNSSLIIQQHPQFTYKLWKPADFGPLLSETFGEGWKKLPPYITRDLAAAQILLKEGGIVIDLESECVQSVAEILPLGSCLIGFEPPLPTPQYQRRLFLTSSFIASVPDHRILSKWAALMSTRLTYLISEKNIDPLFVCLESLTSAVVSNSEEENDGLLLLGPTFISPIAPAHIKKLHSQLDGVQKRSFIKKAGSYLHLIPSAPFSYIDDKTIFVHMHGGRLSGKYFDTISVPKPDSEAISS